MVQSSKFCTKCNIRKLICEFSPRGGGRTDYQSWCKLCMSAYSTKKAKIAVRRKRGLPDDHPDMQGARPSAPEGATRPDKAGYIQIKASGHHRADKFGWTYEHIIVAEKKYGFPITRVFTVHHKNDKRWDNRPENIELRIGNHGYGGDLIPTILSNPELREEARRIIAEYDAVLV